MENWSLYTEPTADVSSLALACHGAGEFTGAGTGFNGRRLRSSAAVVISSGEGWYESLHTGRVAIHGPAVIWLPPSIEHGYGPGPHGWTEHWMLLSGPTATLLDRVGAWTPDAPIVPLTTLPESLGSSFRDLRTILSGGRGNVASLRTSALCYRVLSDVVDMTTSHAPRGLIEAFTADAAHRVPLSVRARRLGKTPAELREAVRSETGRTPTQLLIETRLARAQLLLAETPLDITTVASLVGFDDPAYFSRQFTRRIGVSPSSFRGEHRRVSDEPT